METASDPGAAQTGRRAVTRWSAVLADPGQEQRFRAARARVMRRDVQVVAAAVLAYNAWSLLEKVRAAAGPPELLASAANNAVLLVACVVAVVVVRRLRSWRGAATVLVSGVAVYTVVNAWSVTTHVFGPDSAVLIAVVSVAVLYLHAQLPLVATACLTLGWTVVSAGAIALAIAGLPPSAPGGGWDVLVEGGVLMVIINVIGVVSTHRSAVGERLLFAEREHVHHLSTTDPLTGAANRRRWEEHLGAAWMRCQQRGLPVGLLVVDVDDFKAVNDSFGHSGGDDVLRCVAGLLADRARRPDDLVARLGGDEFAVVLPGATAEDVREVADQLLVAVHELRSAASAALPQSALAVSVGALAALPVPGATWESAVADADALLYRAKADGRDRVTWSPGGGEASAPAPVTGLTG